VPAVNRFNFSVTYGTREQAIKTVRFMASICGVACAQLYYFRAYDSGTAGYVYWGPYDEVVGHSTPASSETTPNYTGTLSNVHIYYIRR
jgi:hypothetical protein